jgi:hypothetical protein
VLDQFLNFVLKIVLVQSNHYLLFETSNYTNLDESRHQRQVVGESHFQHNSLIRLEMTGTQNVVVVVVVVVVVGTRMVDMMMGCCILGGVGTQMVDMLMEVVEMLMMTVEMMMRTRSVVGGLRICVRI